MVFGLFARKSTLEDAAASSTEQSARFPTPTPSIASVARPSPLRFSTALRAVLGSSTTDLTLKDSDLATESVVEEGNDLPSPPLPPPETPPPLADTKSLYDLMLTIPPKTLHAFTLAHLRPPPHSTAIDTLCPPSPNTVTKLATFFSTLAPPPLLHCVRCHKDFYDVENEEKDKACRIAHDDESTLVSRASGGGHETHWGCCGQTTPGDGSEGPPDGWCYEGRHTTDIKRARFRSDSTIHRDKLTSCLKLNCHGIRDQLPRRDSVANAGSSSARKSNPSPVRSQASALTSRSARKRPRKSLKEPSGSEDEADTDALVGPAGKAKQKDNVGGGAGKGNEDARMDMAIDEPTPASKPTTGATSRPTSRTRTSTSASMTASTSNVASSKAKRTSKPMTILTMRFTPDPDPGSDASSIHYSSPRPRRRTGGVYEGTRSAKKFKSDSQPTTSEEEPITETELSLDSDSDLDLESEQGQQRGRDRKRRRVGTMCLRSFDT